MKKSFKDFYVLYYYDRIIFSKPSLHIFKFSAIFATLCRSVIRLQYFEVVYVVMYETPYYAGYHICTCICRIRNEVYIQLEIKSSQP
jgi:hypothetical protein